MIAQNMQLLNQMSLSIDVTCHFKEMVGDNIVLIIVLLNKYLH